jgi:hypothetical protein
MTSPAANLDPLTSMRNPQAVLRLTALWAVVESGLGGLLHAFKLPLTGLVIGGTAVILITLIAHFAKKPREILRATIIVLIIKALVSPHSPVGAYIAVSFQGVLGWLVYAIARPGYVSSIPYALLAMVESAIQKLLMLVLFFGKPLWTAVDSWGAWVIEKYFPSYADEGLSLSWTLVGGYVGAYILGGILIGVLAVQVHKAMFAYLRELADKPIIFDKETTYVKEDAQLPAKKKKKQRKFFWWIGIAVVLGATIYFGNTADDAIISALLYFVRTLAIVAIWYFLVGPLLAKLFRKWLLGKSSQYASDVEEVMELLPELKSTAKLEYARLLKTHSGFALYKQWLIGVLALSLTLQLSPKPVSDVE